MHLDTRMAANALVWADDGVTYRFESALPRDRALAVAKSLQR